MKNPLFALLLFPILLMSCRQDVRLKEKFSEGSKYDVELFLVQAVSGSENTVELRNKSGKVLADPVKIDRNFKPEECEYFFDEDEGENFLNVYVMTGGRNWR